MQTKQVTKMVRDMTTIAFHMIPSDTKSTVLWAERYEWNRCTQNFTGTGNLGVV